MCGPALVAVLGAPGSGKGTQCDRLREEVGLGHVSTGSLLREELCRGSDLGRRVARCVDEGRLVPDAVVVELLDDAVGRLRDRTAVLLDGFPRTVAQAEALDRLWPGAVRAAFELVVPLSVLMRRLRTRGRADDGFDAVRRRLASYAHDTAPVLDWFSSRGLLAHIDGNGPPPAVAFRVARRLRDAGIDLAEHRSEGARSMRSNTSVSMNAGTATSSW